MTTGRDVRVMVEPRVRVLHPETPCAHPVDAELRVKALRLVASASDAGFELSFGMALSIVGELEDVVA